MMFKVIINGVEQEGVFSHEECGEKTAMLLSMMGSVTIQFVRVNGKEAE